MSPKIVEIPKWTLNLKRRKYQVFETKRVLFFNWHLLEYLDFSMTCPNKKQCLCGTLSEGDPMILQGTSCSAFHRTQLQSFKSAFNYADLKINSSFFLFLIHKINSF